MDLDDMFPSQPVVQPDPEEQEIVVQPEDPQQQIEDQAEAHIQEEPQQAIQPEEQQEEPVQDEAPAEEAPKDEFNDLFGGEEDQQVTQAAVEAGAEIQVTQQQEDEDSNEFNIIADPSKYEQLGINFQRHLQQVDDEQANAATGLKTVGSDYRTDSRGKSDKTAVEDKKKQEADWKESLAFIENEEINSWKKISKMIDAENHKSRVYDVLTSKIKDEEAGDAVEELQSANLADF